MCEFEPTVTTITILKYANISNDAYPYIFTVVYTRNEYKNLKLHYKTVSNIMKFGTFSTVFSSLYR